MPDREYPPKPWPKWVPLNQDGTPNRRTRRVRDWLNEPARQQTHGHRAGRAQRKGTKRQQKAAQSFRDGELRVEIIHLTSAGYNQTEIAERLGLHRKTIGSHIAAVEVAWRERFTQAREAQFIAEMGRLEAQEERLTRRLLAVEGQISVQESSAAGLLSAKRGPDLYARAAQIESQLMTIRLTKFKVYGIDADRVAQFLVGDQDMTGEGVLTIARDGKGSYADSLAAIAGLVPKGLPANVRQIGSGKGSSDV